MADLSQVELNGTTYDLKDLTIRRAHGLDPIATKTYTNVIATANDNNGAGFFYLKVRADAYTTAWHVKTRVKATVPGNVNYNTDTIFDIWGYANTYSWYACLNRIRSTSYRPIYYNSLFRLNETGYNNGCANWVGFSLVGATNNTSSSYKRQVIVELLEYDGCSVELQDSLITPTNIPERAAHTNWYTSTNTSFDNFDACSYGLKQSGDANTTDIVNLTFANGTYIADSAVYRNQLLFQKDENTLTPLNNNDNTTETSKTMLTTVEFDPFGRIAYYNSTTNISAGGSIGASPLFWSRSNVDLRYTFNCGTTLTAQKPFYLVVTPTSNGLCKIASTTPWAQTLPSTNDGKWYILLGRTYSTYQMALYAYHPVYYHDGLKVKMLVEPEPSTNSVMTLDASGDIATFNHASTDVPLKSLVVDIEPNQAGSGDPSPTNVRPISGWTGLSGVKSNGNLFDPDANPTKFIDASGNIITNGTTSRTTEPIYINSGITKAWLKSSRAVGAICIASYDKDNHLLLRTAQLGVLSISQNIPSGTAYVRFAKYGTAGEECDLCANFGDTATEGFPAYTGTTIAVSWQTEAGTVYGGTVDVVTGVLTATHRYVLLDGTQTINKHSTTAYNGFHLNLANNGLPACASTEDGTVGQFSYYKLGKLINANGNAFVGSNTIQFRNDSLTTKDEAIAYLTANPLQVVYPLATPRTYQLTPQQIHALKGTNVIYTNCGPVKVEYYTESMIQATDSYAGLMSAVDKRKLDSLSGIVISETEPTNDGVLAWIDPDASDTIGILSETEINSQYVSHEHAQTLTSAQQNRALQNIGISNGTDAQKTNLATFAGISLTVVGTI